MQTRKILDAKLFNITIERLCYQLIENHNDFSESAIIGLQPRGIFLAERIYTKLSNILNKSFHFGTLDVTFFRDDFRRRDELLVPTTTNIDFVIEDKRVILVDDVLFTGRTIRAGLDAILAFGRPKQVELLTLIDRRYSRHLPIEATYVGHSVDTLNTEKVKVDWKETDGEDQVLLVIKGEGGRTT